MVVIDSGMECHVLQCEWLDGRPDSGHLQEAARNARFFFTFVIITCSCRGSLILLRRNAFCCHILGFLYSNVY